MIAPFINIHGQRAACLLMMSAVALLTGCGGGGGDSQSGSNQVVIPAAQANYDGAVAAVDAIAAPVGGASVLTAADIIAVQTSFDKVADSLLSL